MTGPLRSRPTLETSNASRPRSEALASLLVDLGSKIQRGPQLQRGSSSPGTGTSLFHRSAAGAPAREAGEAPAHAPIEEPREGPFPSDGSHPTGIDALDRCLGGGFPAGRLSEICSDSNASGASVGRTSLALGLLAETLARGVLAAWVDLADAFDPESARGALQARGGDGTELDRLLWIRARDEDEALRCCERVMKTEGFELVVFDLCTPGLAPGPSRARPAMRPPKGIRPPRRLRINDVTWLRLARLAAGTRTTLVALTKEPRTGSRAEMTLEMQPHRAHFTAPPALLEGLECHAVLRRHRSRPTGRSVPLSFSLSPSDSSAGED